MKKLIFALAVLVLTVPCLAEIIIVDDDWPYDFDNIQAAIDYSSDGDFIFVFPGTYTGTGNYDIDFLGKAVTVRSIDPTDPYFVAQTTIDCNGLGRGFYFHNGEGTNSILAGFTITNAHDGGIYCNSSPTIVNCTIIANSTESSGGGIGCSGNPTITNCTITGNSANNYGGGIYCNNPTRYSSPKITNCVINGNTANKNSGGGIYCGSGSSPTIANCTITANSTASSGGGIGCSSSPTITNCIITSNLASYDGGGIYYGGSYTTPTITSCTITDNSAGRYGGGIDCGLSGNPTITNCTINSNSAGDYGGGICCRQSNPPITNCIISANLANGDGGGIHCGNGSPTITNCTITGNSASTNFGAGGIGSYGSYLPISITNTIVWNNANNSGTGQSAQISAAPPTPDVWFSCIQDDNPNDANIPFDANNYNIDDDPCFVEAGFWVDANDPNIIVEPNDPNAVWLDGDYHLLFASPCIETGDPNFIYYDGKKDIDGQPRLMGRRVDIGADEFEITTVVTKPQAGEVWAAGSTHEIKWDSYDITGTVDIYYSDNNGVDDWIMIDNAPDTGSFLWHLPEAVDSNRCLVSVEPNVPVQNLICTPSGLFTIHPCPPGPPVPSKWKSLGGDFDRSGLSQNFGPELGCVKWQFQTNGPVSASPTIGAAGRVHLSCEDGRVYTLDANGQLLWSYDTDSPLLSSPSIGPDGSVYVGAENGMLYAIDVNGNLRWTHSTDGFIYSSPAVSADGNVFVCSQDGSLYALGRDGSELWTFDTDSYGPAFTGAVFASPAVGPNGTIYIAGLYDPNLYALDPNDGHIKWSRSFLDPNSKKPWPFASPVIAADGTIYVSPLFDPNLYAVDSNNGSIIWATNLADPCYSYKYVWSEPALGPDGTIYVSFNDPYLRAVNPDGTIKWVTRLGVMGGFTLTIGSDGLIYAASDDAYLCVIDPDGEEIARFKGGSWLSFPVITADNTMIVSDENNTVWAIGGVGCEEQAAALHRPQDLNTDWAVSFEDFALIANDWLKPNCFAPGAKWPCEYLENGFYFVGDIDRDLYVNFADLAELANRWLVQE
jgi:parallel beta-helix repeat protein